MARYTRTSSGRLQEATGADELIIITAITHDHADRVRPDRLLAAECHRRHPVTAQTKM